jgi:hypothetical protein
MINGYIFDIETGPLPIEQLVHVMPTFEAPSNWKDDEKIKAKIAEQESKWFDRAALDARTGEVLAIGLSKSVEGESETIILDRNQFTECELLSQFWDMVSEYRSKRWIGFNIFNFDLPFLMRRSLFHGVTPGLQLSNSRYFDPRFIDIMNLWQCGNREQTINLNSLAKFVGLPGKSGSGADFAEWFKTEPERAKAYLTQDLELTKQIADRMITWIDAGTKERQPA